MPMTTRRLRNSRRRARRRERARGDRSVDRRRKRPRNDRRVVRRYEPARRRGSEGHAVPALQAEHSSRLGGRRDLAAELLDDGAYLADLLRVAARELAFTDEQAVLEADAH